MSAATRQDDEDQRHLITVCACAVSLPDVNHLVSAASKCNKLATRLLTDERKVPAA
jgi:hypothetical protein